MLQDVCNMDRQVKASSNVRSTTKDDLTTNLMTDDSHRHEKAQRRASTLLWVGVQQRSVQAPQVHHFQSLEIILEGVSHENVVGPNHPQHRRLHMVKLGIYVFQELRSDATIPGEGQREVVRKLALRVESSCHWQSKEYALYTSSSGHFVVRRDAISHFSPLPSASLNRP